MRASLAITLVLSVALTGCPALLSDWSVAGRAGAGDASVDGHRAQAAGGSSGAGSGGSGSSSGSSGGSGGKDSGASECVPKTKDCLGGGEAGAGLVPRTCQNDGTWVDDSRCSYQCAAGTCVSPTCTDGVKNENESGVDCGGETCPTCANGQTCNVNADCQIANCLQGVCTAPVCVTNGIKDGTETGIDCGGGCSTCPIGQACIAGTDCATFNCSGGSCVCPSYLPPSVNVDVSQWAASFPTSPTWNCNAAGTTTIDSSAGTITSTSCTLRTLDFTNNVAQSTGGPNVMVVRLRGLTVSNNHVLQLSGDKPIILLVAGGVVVDTGGKIDASAVGTTAGPGGSIAAQCTGSTGTNSGATSTGGGGGGFGTPGGDGAKIDGTSGSEGGVVSSGTDLQPLRGGCSGGTGGAALNYPGGAGGGAFEISASGTITIGHSGDTSSTTGILSAAGGFQPERRTRAPRVRIPVAAAPVAAAGFSLVAPAVATFGTNGAARAHGGGSGLSRGVNGAGNSGTNGHAGDDTAASGGAAPDINGAVGATGGLCSGNDCGVASASGSNGTRAATGANLDGSGGGGGGGRVQIVTHAATLTCP